MGAHSTIHITEPAAKNFILRKLATASKEDLERIMDVLVYDSLYNVAIDWDSCEDNDNSVLDHL